MALLITKRCINCDMCEPEWPNQAIPMGEEYFSIDSARRILSGYDRLLHRRVLVALLITKRCINCDMCEPEWPNQAIPMGEEYFSIDSARRIECIGHYDAPACQGFVLLITPLSSPHSAWKRPTGYGKSLYCCIPPVNFQ
ncbi:hypothetical protein EHS86_12070 [Erwinia amylovora]|uniref:NADH dehydrogenase n=2 Tax=Erwinia amylovora TaxID=552 RepID=A0A830ZUV7_ERWAM|nr:hypothetical protein AD997_12865 [Erwinia amylovora]EKV53174.1 NADH dehydrogenase [Erwinia amylovora ACW56400]CBA22084.1 NADH dehydrogenase [Erwinia amylovora CFBP1430]CCO79485.1 NADH dehydrogenase [Erwinia amylovora Ea356]CCO90845.1 NADH dehydrogenase [Erwinia amylovora 01SFR-BO]CCO94627.1 NADH dehydrogenase [Erwinia amylovora NBRC 12687 = CFBP 1232]CCO99958.1 NADH dehydrogenase [Erwinia amylovora UPN527]CDK16013.1 NADH dehydrogenase [Erwinia amylovora LA635]CDK19380.1 NADH dehydrogenas